MSIHQIISTAVENGAIRNGGEAEAAVPFISIYEKLIGIGTAARTCEHLLRAGEPDITEVRAMVSHIIAASNRAITIIRD